MAAEENGESSPMDVPAHEVEGDEAPVDQAEDMAAGDVSVDGAASDKMTIHVAAVPVSISEEDLRELFGAKGELTRCEMKTRRGRYCFVEYKDDSITKEVLEQFQSLLLSLSRFFSRRPTRALQVLTVLFLSLSCSWAPLSWSMFS